MLSKTILAFAGLMASVQGKYQLAEYSAVEPS
jgi:hypothetical protein